MNNINNFFRKSINNKFLSNSLWMIAEKVISIFGLLFVTSFVAKYIGPANFGKLTYVASIFIIVQALSMFGSEHVLLRRVAKNRRSGIKLMVSTTWLRHATFIILAVAILFYLYIESDRITFIFGVATAVAYYFASIDIFTIYNNAVLNSKFNTYCNITGLVISLIARYVIALFELDMLYLCIPIVLVTLIPYILKRRLFHKHNEIAKQTNSNKKKYNSYFIKTGAPLALSSVSVIIYTRVTLFFIMAYCGARDLGVYSVASQLATSWMFITSAFVTSFYAKIYAEKDSDVALKLAAILNGGVFLCGLIIVSLIALIGKYLIRLLYGIEYSDSYMIMLILCLNTLFSCMGPVASKFIIFKSGFSFLSIKMIITMVLSLPIAYFFTVKYGVYGAAISTVITEFISLTLLNYLFKRGLIFKIHYKTFQPKTYCKH